MIWTIAYVVAGLIGVVAIVAIILVAIATSRPDTFTVQRSAVINAPPERVFPLINDFHNWAAWSPWEKLDSAMTKTHSGSASGQGAEYEWEGNKKVGKGRMEIVESTPPSRIVIQLDFFRPFAARNTTEYTLAPKGNSTNVTWAMHGRQPLMFKVMSLFMSMDKMIGKDFESGLASMKAIAEG